ncbi:MAG: beta-lactamase family protein [Deltaproteobacteria bacterium]|nr:beta-lactamase family protein [Deltaproteobacteria bacterium]
MKKVKRNLMATRFLRAPASWLALLVLLAQPGSSAGSGLAQQPAVADAIVVLDLWIEEQMTHQALPGLALGVVYEDQLVWAKGYGYADLESRSPVTPETLFRIGSITKLFTSTAILQLRDQGKLHLDDPLVRHLPWFSVESPFENTVPITLRHLLTHTSGLPREAAIPYWTSHIFPAPEELRRVVPTQRAVYPPETQYKYSNLGMALLGEVVARVSGMPYQEYVSEQIFRPLDMEDSTVSPSPEHHGRMVTAYRRQQPDGGRGVFAYYDTAGLASAANIVSSVGDLARFAALHLVGAGRADGAPVVKLSTLREMQRPHWVNSRWSGGRGLGFGLSHRQGKTVVSHGGWVGGNRSHLLLVPKEKLGVIAMTNADDGSPSQFSYQVYDALGPAILSALEAPSPEGSGVPKPLDSGASHQETARKAPADWQRYVGKYEDPWGWQYEVLVLGDRLAVYEHNYPPEESSTSSLTRLEPIGEHRFRLPDGESMVFELDAKGRVERIQRRYEYLYPQGLVPPEGQTEPLKIPEP